MKILSNLPGTLVLNEPRELYLNTLGHEMDVWSPYATELSKLDLTASDVASRDEKIAELRRAYGHLKAESNCDLLLDKMPENIFRAEFLAEAFPEAKFIILRRNCVETARSIASFHKQTWYGRKDAKWNALKRLVSAGTFLSEEVAKDLGFLFEEGTEQVPSLHMFSRGLIEWFLATKA